MGSERWGSVMVYRNFAPATAAPITSAVLNRAILRTAPVCSPLHPDLIGVSHLRASASPREIPARTSTPIRLPQRRWGAEVLRTIQIPAGRTAFGSHGGTKGTERKAGLSCFPTSESLCLCERPCLSTETGGGDA